MNNLSYTHKKQQEHILTGYESGIVTTEQELKKSMKTNVYVGEEPVRKEKVKQEILDIAERIEFKKGDFIVRTNGDQKDLKIDDKGELTELVK